MPYVDKVNIGGTVYDFQDSEAQNQLAALNNQVTNVKSAINLLDETLMDTVQAITFDSSGNVSQITHSKNGAVVRTDAFTFGTNTITEVRTLAASGESVTIVTNTTTLETTVTYAAA